VSQGPTGLPASADSVLASGGADESGRVIVFTSAARELVAATALVPAQVVLRDRTAGASELVTVTPTGTPSSGAAAGAAVSADGRRVVFASLATDLVSASTGGLGAVFLRDRQAGVTTLLTRGVSGGPADGASADPVISADGAFVAFDSTADNLVVADHNGARDVFLVETATGVVSLVSVTTGGAQGTADSAFPALSPDGRFVAFASAAPELVPGLDLNGTFGDVYLRDRVLGTTTLVSGDATRNTGDGPSGGPGMQAVALAGARVAFTTRAGNLLGGLPAGVSQVLVRDMATGVFLLGSAANGGAPGNGDSLGCSLSRDGRFVAFVSLATNLDPSSLPAPGVYVRDLDTGRTARIDPSPTAGGPSPALGAPPVVSPDGTTVAWTAQAGTTTPAGATAGVAEVFAAPNPLAP
jgi:Tol biopolymer transport system component